MWINTIQPVRVKRHFFLLVSQKAPPLAPAFRHFQPNTHMSECRCKWELWGSMSDRQGKTTPAPNDWMLLMHIIRLFSIYRPLGTIHTELIFYRQLHILTIMWSVLLLLLNVIIPYEHFQGAQKQTFIMHVHALQQVVADRLLGLHAQSVDVGRRVVTRECRQVDAGHSFQEPGCLGRKILLGHMSLMHKQQTNNQSNKM